MACRTVQDVLLVSSAKPYLSKYVKVVRLPLLQSVLAFEQKIEVFFGGKNIPSALLHPENDEQFVQHLQ